MRPHLAFGVVLVLLASAGFPAPALAGPQVPIGPRAIAMGGAFSAIADDASALYWNPAGLMQLESQEFAGSLARLYGTGVEDNRLAFALPVTRRNAVGLEWYSSGFSDDELRFHENRFALSGAWRVERRLFVGLSGKFVTRSFGLATLDEERGTGVGADLGVLASPHPDLRLGLVAQDLFDTSLRYDDGRAVRAFPRNLRVGAAYRWSRRLTAAFDLDDRWHIGLETRPTAPLALLAGVQGAASAGEAGEGATWSTGVGARIGPLRFDYAYVIPPTLASTHHLGFSVAFNFNPPLLHYDAVNVREHLYASLYKNYATEARSLGDVLVTTRAEQPVSAVLSILVPGLMVTPYEEEITLRPGVQSAVPLRAVFDERVMDLTQDRPVQVEVSLRYTSLRLERTDRIRGRATLYRPGAIDWSLGLDQAGAFVTARDPSIEALGAEIGRLVDGMPLAGIRSMPRETQLIATAVDALATLGIQYKPDPLNAYSVVKERRGAVDTIYYPSETLSRRVGDCDDMTVLTAALLSNLGVETRFVDAPGHILLIADSGLGETDPMRLTLSKDRLIAIDGRLWIPLETTEMRNGFASVWSRGGEQWHHLDTGDRGILVDVGSARARYPDANPATQPPTRRLNPDSLAARVAASNQVFAGWRSARLGELQALVSPLEPGIAGLVEVARLDFQGGEFGRVRRSLEQALEFEPRRPDIMANLATAEALDGALARAIVRYQEALRGDPDDFITWWNAAIALEEAGELPTAEQFAGEAIRRAGGAGALRRALVLAGARALEPGTADRAGVHPATSLNALMARGDRWSRQGRSLDPTQWRAIRLGTKTESLPVRLAPWLAWRGP